MEVLEENDNKLWKIAKKRADFKRHLYTYLIINGFFWALWLFKSDEDRHHLWPIWPMLGWGIGLLFHYISAYRDKDTLAEKEYEKLKNQRK